MAKKKTAETANIKAAPVLRAGSGGGQPTPETPVITKSYSVRDDWKDKDKVNYVAFKSVDGEVQDLTVNGQPAGGGGGMFTTAKLVAANNSRMVAVPYIYTDQGMSTILQDAVLENAGDEITIVLVNGMCIMRADTAVTVTGAAEVLDDDEGTKIYKVTGNVTLS